MGLDYNNISFPTINYNLSGSVSDPIVQGTFQSGESVSNGWDASVTNNSLINASPASYGYGSKHVYLRLNLGKIRDLGDYVFGNLNSISGIYVQGTILKTNFLGGASNSTNITNTVMFEHYGNIYLPYITTFDSDYWLDLNNHYQYWTTEFVVKSRTYHIDSSTGQPTHHLEGLPWGGQMSNFQGGQGQYFTRTAASNAYPIFFDQDSYPYSQENDTFLNCQITFGSNVSEQAVSGFIVKGTYLLV